MHPKQYDRLSQQQLDFLLLAPILEILDFIISCNLTFILLSDCLYIAIVFKPIVNT